VSDDQTRHSGSRWEPTPREPTPDAAPADPPDAGPADGTGDTPTPDRPVADPPTEHLPTLAAFPAWTALPPVPGTAAPRPRRALRRTGLLAAAGAALLAVGGAGGYLLGHDATASAAPTGSGVEGGPDGGTSGFGHHRGFGPSGRRDGTGGGTQGGATQGGPAAGDGSTGNGTTGTGAGTPAGTSTGGTGTGREST
jgi:hypothetical protein